MRRAPRCHHDNAARILVLPVENLGHPENDDFAAGITDHTAGRLAAAQGLAVISPSTAPRYTRTRGPLWAHGGAGLCRFMDAAYKRLDF